MENESTKETDWKKTKTTGDTDVPTDRDAKMARADNENAAGTTTTSPTAHIFQFTTPKPRTKATSEQVEENRRHSPEYRDQSRRYAAPTSNAPEAAADSETNACGSTYEPSTTSATNAQESSCR